MVESLRGHERRQKKERLRAIVWEDHGLVFPSQVGTPMEPRNLQRHWHGLRRRLDLQGVRLHDLRHSYASLLLAAGVPMRVVMEMLGHSSMTLTANTYTHVLDGLQQEAVGRLDELFGSRPWPQ